MQEDWRSIKELGLMNHLEEYKRPKVIDFNVSEDETFNQAYKEFLTTYLDSFYGFKDNRTGEIVKAREYLDNKRKVKDEFWEKLINGYKLNTNEILESNVSNCYSLTAYAISVFKKYGFSMIPYVIYHKLYKPGTLNKYDMTHTVLAVKDNYDKYHAVDYIVYTFSNTDPLSCIIDNTYKDKEQGKFKSLIIKQLIKPVQTEDTVPFPKDGSTYQECQDFFIRHGVDVYDDIVES